jgi:hypothetical protein
LPHLWPTGSSSEWPPSITARYFSSCPSDSTSRWTPCPPETTRIGSRSALVCVRLSPSCPFRLLHTCLPLSGPRGITPAFRYGAPHPSARGTSTPLSNALLSAHYRPSRIPLVVHRLPGVAGYTASLLRRFLDGTRRVSPVAQHDLATVLPLPTPPKCLAASVLATLHAAFAREVRARPSGCSTLEAIYGFTCVTARWLARHP